MKMAMKACMLSVVSNLVLFDDHTNLFHFLRGRSLPSQTFRSTCLSSSGEDISLRRVRTMKHNASSKQGSQVMILQSRRSPSGYHILLRSVATGPGCVNCVETHGRGSGDPFAAQLIRSVFLKPNLFWTDYVPHKYKHIVILKGW